MHVHMVLSAEYEMKETVFNNKHFCFKGKIADYEISLI